MSQANSMIGRDPDAGVVRASMDEGVPHPKEERFFNFGGGGAVTAEENPADPAQPHTSSRRASYRRTSTCGGKYILRSRACPEIDGKRKGGLARTRLLIQKPFKGWAVTGDISRIRAIRSIGCEDPPKPLHALPFFSGSSRFSPFQQQVSTD